MADGPGYIISVGPPGGTPERVDDVRVLSLTFEDDESKADKLTLLIDNYDLSQFHSPRWRKGNIIYFQFGYIGNLSPPREATIQKRKGKNPMTVEAQGKEAQLNKIHKVRTFEQMKRSDIARKIAKEYGVRDEQLHIEDTELVLEQMVQASMTDLQMLRDMANREGFQVYFDYDGFHFHRRKLADPPVHVLTYFIDQEGGDLLDFNIEDDGKAGNQGGVVLQGRDPLTKEDIDERADRSTESDRPTLGSVIDVIDAKTATSKDVVATTDVAQARAIAQEVVMPSTETTKAATRRQATGVFLDKQLSALKLTTPCIGDPKFEAKKVAELRGIGQELSGRYYATNAKHELKDDYKMTVTWKRDAKTGGSGGGVPAKGVENTKPADENASTKLVEVESIDAVTATSGKIVYRQGKG
ncbi:MAG: hypothetical protein HOW73_43110 [Polyangiaceae bacterium]|nr:hypothetical protein [Polyangiaceae bacterium]